MLRLAIILGLLLVSSCRPEEAQKLDQSTKPMRIVSLDYCADQYVLKLVDRSRILGVSPDAVKRFSYMREAAKGVPSIKPLAEDVILQKPDLVVRSYGGGPNAAAFFEQVGIPVLNIGWANDLDGIKDVTAQMAEGLGEVEKGKAIIEQMNERLAAIPPSKSNLSALYMTPSGVTTGPGSLVHEMIIAAGFSNFQTEYGWRSLPLERLAYEQPDLIAAAFFESKTNHKDAWSAMRNPVARKQIKHLATVPLEGAWTSCGSWFLVDAIEALAAERIKQEGVQNNAE